MSESNSTSGGVGFTGLLQIVFITLKLCNVINWSWVWVLSPAWGILAVIVFLLLLWGILVLIRNACESPQERTKRKLKDAFTKMSKKL